MNEIELILVGELPIKDNDKNKRVYSRGGYALP